MQTEDFTTINQYIFAVTNQHANNNLEVFLIGVDNKLYHNFFDENWHTWEEFGEGLSVSSVFAVTNQRANNNLEVFLVGVDNKLYHNFFDGNWHTWGEFGEGLSASSVFAVTNQRANNNLEVFLIGEYQSMGKRLHHNFYDEKWQGWREFGDFNSGSFEPFSKYGANQGFFAKSGFAVTNQRFNNNLEVFFISPNGNFYHNYHDGVWHGWEQKNYRLNVINGFAATNQNANGRIEVFLICRDNDNALSLYTEARDGFDRADSTREWSAWGNDLLGEPLFVKSGFAATNHRANNNLELFLIGVDNRIYHRHFDSEGWHINETKMISQTKDDVEKACDQFCELFPDCEQHCKDNYEELTHCLTHGNSPAPGSNLTIPISAQHFGTMSVSIPGTSITISDCNIAILELCVELVFFLIALAGIRTARRIQLDKEVRAALIPKLAPGLVKQIRLIKNSQTTLEWAQNVSILVINIKNVFYPIFKLAIHSIKDDYKDWWSLTSLTISALITIAGWFDTGMLLLVAQIMAGLVQFGNVGFAIDKVLKTCSNE